jgi:hypothetical protein
VTELLGGFAGVVRARALARMEPQTALLALLTFVIICATWIDAWQTERSVTLDFAGLWAPILIGTTYYLAAAVIFPKTADGYDDLGAYYAGRKRFVALMLIIAELLVTYTYRAKYLDTYQHRPIAFWLWNVPYKLAILASYVGIWVARGRRANMAWLVAGLVLFTLAYWQYQVSIGDLVARHFGH